MKTTPKPAALPCTELIDALERRYLRHNIVWLRMMTSEGKPLKHRERLERKLQRLESALDSASIATNQVLAESERRKH